MAANPGASRGRFFRRTTGSKGRGATAQGGRIHKTSTTGGPTAFGKGLKVKAIRKAGRPSLDGLWGEETHRSGPRANSRAICSRSASRRSASLQQSQHAAGGRKQRRVGVGETEQLKPERKAAVLKDGKRDRGNAEHRAGNHKRRIPRPVEADRGRARRRQRQAGVEFLRQRLIDGAPSLTLGDVAAIVVEGHRLSPCGEVVHRLAELARV